MIWRYGSLLAAALALRSKDDAPMQPSLKFVDACLEENATCVEWDDPERGYLKLKTGDLVFFSSTDRLSQIQMSFTGAEVMHTAMVVWSKPITGGVLQYVPAHEPHAVLGLLEVSNHALPDMVTAESKKGFHYVDMYSKLTIGWPEGTQVFIKPRKKELDAEAMDQLVTLSACFHTRRVDYLQMFTTSESLLGKFYHTWTKSTREATEKFENMFCSQFAALMVMVWDGSLQMNRDKTITPVNTSAVRMHFAGARELLPGDFDPGDVLRIENGHFGETYQLQIPYDHYQKYDDLAARQEAESLFVRGQTKNDLMRTCLAKLPSVEYVSEHLPTFAHKMQEWLRKHTCDTQCGAYHMEFPATSGGPNVTWEIFSGWGEGERAQQDYHRRFCMADCAVVEAGSESCSHRGKGFNKVAKQMVDGKLLKVCCRTIRCAWNPSAHFRGRMASEEDLREFQSQLPDRITTYGLGTDEDEDEDEDEDLPEDFPHRWQHAFSAGVLSGS